MTIGRTDKVWIGLGVAGAIIIVLIAWSFFISPQTSQTSDLRSQTTAAQLDNNTLEAKLATLRAQNKDLATYQATLAQDRAALPSSSGMPDFLREVQTVGSSTQVAVSALNVGLPAPVTSPIAGAAASVYSIAITLNASGSPDQLTQFLDQLQSVQPRAVLISQASLQSASASSGQTTLTLTMSAFVAPVR